MNTFFLVWLSIGTAGGFRLAGEARTLRGFCGRMLGCMALGPAAFLVTPKRD